MKIRFTNILLSIILSCFTITKQTIIHGNMTSVNDLNNISTTVPEDNLSSLFSILKELEKKNYNKREIYKKDELDNYLELKDTLTNMTESVFNGEWTSNIDLPYLNSNNGKISIKFNLQKFYTLNKDFYYDLNFSFDFITNQNSDFWLSLKNYKESFINSGNIVLTNKDKFKELTFSDYPCTFSENYIAVPYRRLFNNFNITLKVEENNNELINKIDGSIYFSLNSTKVKIDFKSNNNDNSFAKTFSFYTWMMIILCGVLLSINVYMIWLIENNSNEASNLNIFSLLIDMQWNCLIVTCHFNLSTILQTKEVLNLVLVTLFLLYAVIVQSRLVYKTWILSNTDLLIDQDRLKRIFITTYCLFFGSFFILANYSYNIFCEKSWILFFALNIWAPTIIKNLVTNDIKHPPLIYCYIVSLNRIILPIFYRTNKNNFFHLKTEAYFISLIVLIVIAQHLILYYQAKHSGSSILPQIIRNKMKRYLVETQENVTFMTETEFKELYPGKIKQECIICMHSILEDCLNSYNSIEALDENLMPVNNNTLNLPSEVFVRRDNELQEVNSINNYTERQNEVIHQIDPFKKQMKFFERLFELLFKFHYYNKVKSFDGRPICVTIECSHIFHTPCVLDWFSTKKICPVDRLPIKISL